MTKVLVVVDQNASFQDAMAFGRPGCGAPQRTKSGRIRTAIFGNPEIRFQANESVKKTINNNIRSCLMIRILDIISRLLLSDVTSLGWFGGSTG